MKLRIYSDIHNEFVRGDEWKPPVLDSDANSVLVLLGDIDIGKHYTKFVTEMAERFRAVVYILGNHEYYGGNIDKRDIFKSEAENAYLLDNSTVTIDGVEFVGTTLWTDLGNEDQMIVWRCQGRNSLNDFVKIRQRIVVGKGPAIELPSDEFLGPVNVKYPRLSAARWLRENKIAKEFLASAIDSSKKQVVLTHHAPDFCCSAGNVKAGNSFDAYYYNNGLQNEIGDSKLWLFGHTHHKFDSFLGDCRVYSNPRGYPVIELVPGFDEIGIVEI